MNPNIQQVYQRRNMANRGEQKLDTLLEMMEHLLGKLDEDLPRRDPTPDSERSIQYSHVPLP